MFMRASTYSLVSLRNSSKRPWLRAAGCGCVGAELCVETEVQAF